MSELGLAEFAAAFLDTAIEVSLKQKEIMDFATALIQEKAKGYLGTYQDKADPFSGWKELARETKEEREYLGFPPNEPLLRTGTLRDSIGRDFNATEGSVGSNEKRAITQELGGYYKGGRVPPRSFLGIATVRSKDEIELRAGEEIVAALKKGSGVIRGIP